MSSYQNAVIIQFEEGDMGLFNPDNPSPRTYVGEDYVTKDGDSLFSLANLFYGDTRQWFLIYEANIQILNNPFELAAGTTLLIPR